MGYETVGGKIPLWNKCIYLDYLVSACILIRLLKEKINCNSFILYIYLIIILGVITLELPECKTFQVHSRL